MIDRIDTNQIRETLEKSAALLPDASAPRVDTQIDASLQTDFASLIEDAVQSPQKDEQAVQNARELLASGQLETPQNFIGAAMRIIDLGI